MEKSTRTFNCPNCNRIIRVPWYMDAWTCVCKARLVGISNVPLDKNKEYSDDAWYPCPWDLNYY